MKNFRFFCLTILLLGACKNTRKLANANSEQTAKNAENLAKTIFTLEKTACYGTCPVYKLNVFENDSLVFEGERFVGTIGLHTKKLKKGTVAQLKKTFREANFFNFKSSYEAHISDLPTTIIAFNDESKKLKITDYHGSPETLKNLEQLLANLVADEVQIKKE